MKKATLAIFSALTFTGAASAQTFFEGTDAELTYNLTGTVKEICGLTAATQAADIDFGELADTPAGSQAANVASEFGMVCNSAAGGVLTATSMTDGYLSRDGSAGGEGNQILYKVNIGTGSRDIGATTGTPPKALTNTGSISYDIVGSSALRSGVPVGVSFTINGVKGPDFQGAPTTTVFAGDYSDTVKISFVAN